MASSGQAITVTLYAFIAATNLGKTGDAANIVARVIADGTEATPAGSVAEVDATNCPGLYKVALTGAENTGNFMTAHGKSSTGGVVVLPVSWTNEKLPTEDPGDANGLLIAGSNAATTLASLTATGDLAVGGNLAITGNLSAAEIIGALQTAAVAAFWNSLLDLSNGVETGLTVRQAMRAGAAADAGTLSGAGTVTQIINGAGTTTPRITATVDPNGNRQAITLSL